MTSKKKTSAAPSEPPPSIGGGSVSADVAAPATPARLTPAQDQIRTFELALQSFGQRRFAEATTQFEHAMKGPASHVADKARSYAQVCSRKMADRELNLNTAEDFFNYGVERLNSRDLEQARSQFSKAIALDPAADHIFYAMALGVRTCRRRPSRV